MVQKTIQPGFVSMTAQYPCPKCQKVSKAKTVGQCNKLYVMNLRNILAEWYLIKLFSFISRDLLEGHRQSLYGWKTKTNL